MSAQKVSIPWGTDETDAIHLTWDDSDLPGAVVVTITSDVNTTAPHAEKILHLLPYLHLGLRSKIILQ